MWCGPSSHPHPAGPQRPGTAAGGRSSGALLALIGTLKRATRAIAKATAQLQRRYIISRRPRPARRLALWHRQARRRAHRPAASAVQTLRTRQACSSQSGPGGLGAGPGGPSSSDAWSPGEMRSAMAVGCLGSSSVGAHDLQRCRWNRCHTRSGRPFPSSRSIGTRPSALCYIPPSLVTVHRHATLGLALDFGKC